MMATLFERFATGENITSPWWLAVEEENRDVYAEWCGIVDDCDDDAEDESGWNMAEVQDDPDGRKHRVQGTGGCKREAASALPEHRVRQLAKHACKDTWKTNRRMRERKRKVGRATKGGQLDEPTECFRGESGEIREYAVHGYGGFWLRGGGGGAVETGMSLMERRERRNEHDDCLQHMIQERVCRRGTGRRVPVRGWHTRTVLAQMAAEARDSYHGNQPWDRNAHHHSPASFVMTRETVANPPSIFWAGFTTRRSRLVSQEAWETRRQWLEEAARLGREEDWETRRQLLAFALWESKKAEKTAQSQLAEERRKSGELAAELSSVQQLLGAIVVANQMSDAELAVYSPPSSPMDRVTGADGNWDGALSAVWGWNAPHCATTGDAPSWEGE